MPQRPDRAQRGKPVRASEINKLGKSAVQNVSVIRGRYNKSANSLNLSIPSATSGRYLIQTTDRAKNELDEDLDYLHYGYVVNQSTGTVSEQMAIYVDLKNTDYDAGDTIWCLTCPAYLRDDDNTKNIYWKDWYLDGYSADQLIILRKNTIRLMVLSSAGSAASMTVIKWDSTRSGACYLGHIWSEAGTQSTAVQFKFPNDSGVADLISTGAYVMAYPAPEWDISNWTNSTDKYWAILTPYAAFS